MYREVKLLVQIFVLLGGVARTGRLIHFNSNKITLVVLFVDFDFVVGVLVLFAWLLHTMLSSLSATICYSSIASASINVVSPHSQLFILDLKLRLSKTRHRMHLSIPHNVRSNLECVIV